MTAFASRSGSANGATWAWEVRSVNARGLDLRLRLPDGIEGLEADVRAAFTKVIKRGNISLSLRLTLNDDVPDLALDDAQLSRVLSALDQIQERAFTMGVTLSQPTTADVLNQRGVVRHGPNDGLSSAIVAAIKADIAPLLHDLIQMREREGQSLNAIIATQLSEIAGHIANAEVAVAARRTDAAKALETALNRVLESTDLDPDRLAQEIAVLAVKTDVTEEIDRLKAHVSAASELLEAAQKEHQPVGRKLDFLSQEFNREANTLCSKAQHTKLTSVGLDLKTLIDQMREQIQNVE
ncbi:YicC/YloC family endoribonuclease [Yoonia sp.]|uniref:YicC/YloC family endoribonuclease n=1 Tax=Yoonia sp. TaxID=2212373 RepID=UPI00289E17EE|nr:YicC/YloC family endoribonuclease [Yoonia sp.]